MLSYRHSFHAGNHADVLKHTVQSLIIESLKEKDKPFLYLDTHAGGRALSVRQRTCRAYRRISRRHRPYLAAGRFARRTGGVHQCGKNTSTVAVSCVTTPGSPLIARLLLREQDSLQLTELHPSDYPLLRSEFQKDSRARVEKSRRFPAA